MSRNDRSPRPPRFRSVRVPAFLRQNRRHLPTAFGILAAVVLAWYLVYSQLLVREMQREAVVHSRIVATLFAGLTDPSKDPNETLLELSGEVQALEFPIVLTDGEGFPVSTINLDWEPDLGDSADIVRVLRYAESLATDHPPIVKPGLGTLYYGDAPTVRRMRWIPWLQVGAMVCLLVAAGWMVNHNARTERERIWAAMARESAHQMATPLSSLAGWVEILRLPEEERAEMATLPAVAAEMEADLDRLEKVARRFEWIGRPVQTEAVEVRPMLKVLERYVRVRLPQLRRSVELRTDVADGTPPVNGTGVLLEWALENLIKNAIDALAGAGGHIVVEAEAQSDRRVEIRVKDDGPGVAPAGRTPIFEPGVPTQTSGGGVGLSLARRIVEDVHGGRLFLADTERGATFVRVLPAAPQPDNEPKALRRPFRVRAGAEEAWVAAEKAAAEKALRAASAREGGERPREG